MGPSLVHIAKNDVLAQILKDVLIEHGIDARVCRQGWNDSLTGASWIGDEGIRECEVWIADDRRREEAEAILRNVPSEEAATIGKAWRCGRCGETIEGQFTECWQCGASSADGKELPPRRPCPSRREAVRHAGTGEVVPYEEVRRGLERIRRRRILSVVAFVSFLPVTAALLAVAPSGTALEAVIVPVSFLAVAVFTLFRRESLCPRCGRTYFHARWRRFSGMETWSRCAHCELRVDGSNLEA